MRLQPHMSVRTLHRWETRGVPVRRDENRDAWLKQLAAVYGVTPKTLQNGRAA